MWHIAPDERHGELMLFIDSAGGRIEVSGRGVPATCLQRAPGTPRTAGCLIGTRDRRVLTLTVAGRPAVVHPGPRLLAWGAHRVDAEVDGCRYRLLTGGRGAGTWLRDGELIGRFSRGRDDGEVSARWTERVTIRPRDAALGYLLAVSFGTARTAPHARPRTHGAALTSSGARHRRRCAAAIAPR